MFRIRFAPALLLVLAAGSLHAGSYTTQIESILVKGSRSGSGANIIQINLASPNWIHPVIQHDDASKKELLAALLSAKAAGATVTINTQDNDPNYPNIIEVQY